MAKASKTAPLPAPAQAPYLKHVRLRNAPPLRDVKVDFKPGLNIIIGKNGAGKTNFMKLLTELARPFEDQYRGAGCELTLSSGGHELKLAFNESLSKVSAPHKRLALQPSMVRQPLVVSVTHGKNVREGTNLLEVLEGFATAGILRPSDFNYEIVPVWHGLPFHRLPLVDEAVTMVLSARGVLKLFDSNIEFGEVPSRLVQAMLYTIEGADYFYEAAEKHKSLESLSVVRQFIVQAVDAFLNQLNAYLPLYSPLQEVRRSDQFQVYRNTTKDELIIKGLVLEYKIGNDWLPFSALSDGTKRVFYLIGEVVSASLAFFSELGDEAEFMETPKIILLEEPELGIHPHQLHLLLQLIREVSKQHQVILTTHSPQVLDMLTEKELDRITICDFDPKRGTQMRKLSAEKRKKARFYIKDEGALSEFWRFSNLEDAD